jgi:hypothetical protein
MPTLTLPRQVAELDFQMGLIVEQRVVPFRRDLAKLATFEVGARQRCQVAKAGIEGLQGVVQRSDWYQILTCRRVCQP